MNSLFTKKITCHCDLGERTMLQFFQEWENRSQVELADECLYILKKTSDNVFSVRRSVPGLNHNYNPFYQFTYFPNEKRIEIIAENNPNIFATFVMPIIILSLFFYQGDVLKKLKSLIFPLCLIPIIYIATYIWN